MLLLLYAGIVVFVCIKTNVSISLLALAKEFSWSQKQQGIYLSAFFWGYAIGKLPSIYVVRSLGVKNTLGISVGLTCLLNVISIPIAAYVTSAAQLFNALIVLRFFIGLSGSACFPAMYHSYKLWIPKEQKTLCISSLLTATEVVNNALH